MDPRTNWLLLINAALGNFLAGTSSRIFSVSLPTVANSLETTIVGISWAVIAYQISQISLSLIFGRIGDLYGRHTLFGIGLIVSSIGALLCGLSQNVGPRKRAVIHVMKENDFAQGCDLLGRTAIRRI